MCKSCSAIRCKLFGIVSGTKTELSHNCGVACKTSKAVNIGGWSNIYHDLGDSWSTFIPFLKTLYRVAKARISA